MIFAMSLSSRRAWIEIVVSEVSVESSKAGRSPHGERGLKSSPAINLKFKTSSLSSRRAWIEMQYAGSLTALYASLSSRRAWIEIILQNGLDSGAYVALLTESVD